MTRTGGSLLAVALVVGTAACGTGNENSSTVTRRDGRPVTSAPATLGLTPIAPATTAPGRLDTLPDFEPEPTTTTAATTTVAETTVVTPTAFDGLPRPEPAPIPDAFEARNRIGLLAIPSLGVEQHLYEGVTLTTLDHGPGHWPGTAMPGQTGNVVVAGHRTSRTRPFYDIDKLKPGDEVVFDTAQGRNVYLVTKVQIVNPDALWIIQQSRDKTATLFACHPKGSTAQRIVAFLKYAPERSRPAA